MNATDTKTSFVFERIRRALQEGRYLPGQHIEPLALTRELDVSVTPARYALYQLTGAGLLEIHPRGGFHVLSHCEASLRERYEWMQQLLLDALDRCGDPEFAALLSPAPDPNDIPKSVWKLFDAIAEAADFSELHYAVTRANDQLAPVRRAKQALVDDAYEELAALYKDWASHNLTSLRTGVRAFHRRRIAMAPKIIAHLRQKRAAHH